MLRSSYLYLVLLIISSLPSIVSAQNDPRVAKPMLGVFKAFKELQPYLASNPRFENPANSKTILQKINLMADGFHKISSFDTKYSKAPGFGAQLKAVQSIISDAAVSFKDNPRWSFWKLRELSSHCISCHSTFAVNIQFFDSNTDVAFRNELARGEFLFASRQFDQAEEAFFNAALTPQSEELRADALARWLLIYTRIKNDPVKAYARLQDFAKRAKLSNYERVEIDQWLAAIKNWGAYKSGTDPLLLAFTLIRDSIAENRLGEVRTRTVELLRATGMLHQYLEHPNLPDAKRAEALYLLGLSYSKISSFVVSSYPEIYLEQVIREYPKTQWAKKAFVVYKEIVTLGYLGSSGNSLPDEIKLKFQELFDIAYGIPKINERI